jgi:archaellin
METLIKQVKEGEVVEPECTDDNYNTVIYIKSNSGKIRIDIDDSVITVKESNSIKKLINKFFKNVRSDNR